VRTVAIWIFGLLAGAICGGMLGEILLPYDAGAFWGMLGGLFTFACARLWFAPAKPATEKTKGGR
jgi:hypothetical protein